MKKVKIMFLSLGMVALLSTGACKKDKMTCEEAASAASSASSAFLSSPNEANCNALKDAYSDILESCKSSYTQAQLDAAQAGLDALDCADLPL
ncbi:MAG: hypothetical protein IPN93_15820 [Bacteroidetes bacterium]|nr:hypothetical protein [Bacteroidota bacterium]MBK7505876.1 hypothetical protein [Bacteroidota bacterium]MBK8674387.1 hypothetical protein [Bacteroidota bacterium]MBK9634566.1 hypothetical protein [Bacteroidota bacterium]MBL0287669.1 hypothetical protein [Bacteroidota bacterium]